MAAKIMLLCSLLCAPGLLLHPVEGTISKATDPVSITVSSAKGFAYGDNLLLKCEVVVDNQTGEDLTVLSRHLSAYDGLKLEIVRDGNTVIEKSYPPACLEGSETRPHTLPQGKNQKFMVFRLYLPPADWDKLEVRIVGDLPGSAYKGTLQSNLVKVQRVELQEILG